MSLPVGVAAVNRQRVERRERGLGRVRFAQGRSRLSGCASINQLHACIGFTCDQSSTQSEQPQPPLQLGLVTSVARTSLYFPEAP